MRKPGGVGVFRYGHDELGRLTRIELTLADEAVPVREYEHDFLGRETRRTRGPSVWGT